MKPVYGCTSMLLCVLTVGCGGRPPPQIPQLQRQATVRIVARPSDKTKVALKEWTSAELQGKLAEAALPPQVQRSLEQTLTPLIERSIESIEWQGSGFFIRSGEGDKLFVVSNHHVVNSAQKVNVIVDEHVTINDCDVVYVDRLFDVAVISIPESPAIGDVAVASLSEEEAIENDAIQAAGYPMVNDAQQIYRITPGTVSNQAFINPVDDSNIKLIQHTAAIDSGNSGGPLFKSDTLEVLGINRSVSRTNTNLSVAVPAGAVRDVVKQATETPTGGSPASGALLVQTCRQFIQEMSSQNELRTSALEMISEDLAANRLAAVAAMNQKTIAEASAKHSSLPPRGSGGSGPKRGGNEGHIIDLDEKVRDSLVSVSDGGVKLINAARHDVFQLIRLEILRHGGAETDWCKDYFEQDMKEYERVKEVRMSMSFDLPQKHKHTLSWRFEQGHWRLINFE